MSDSTAASSDQTSLPMEPGETELSKLVKPETPRGNSPLESNAERIRSSLARLSSSSIDDLEALTAELKRMQDFLKSEVGSVHRQIEGALAGINIIIETISPWRNTGSPAASMPGRGYRAGSIEVGPARRLTGGS